MLVDQYGKPIAQEKPKRAISRGMLRAAYDAALDTPENRKHWRWADLNSASAANSIEVRKKLRSRARYECLEANSFAKGICLTLANDTIATGPSLQCNLPDKAANTQIETAWRQWCKATKLASKLRTARLSKTIDGEIFLLKTTNRRLATPVQLDVQLVEADQIATPGFFEGMPNQVDGIEFEDGQPINYHMLEGHPGDVWPQRAWSKKDIAPEDIIHMFRCERPGMVRGIPEVTPALPLFAMLRRYTLATILAAEIAADFAAVLKTAATMIEDEDLDEVDPFSNVAIDRGLMTALPRGYEMQQFKAEQPTTTYEVFRNAILGEIARCVHMPANKARADSSGYNYSSGRLDHQTYYEAIAIERSDWEIECLDRVFSWWLDEALMLTDYLPDLDPMYELPHSWRWPPNRDVDPSELATTNALLIEKGLKTRRQYWSEQNLDPDYMETEVSREQKLLPPADGSTATAEDSTEDDVSGDAPTGEFANISRQQLKRNMQAIDDAIDKIATGEWTTQRATIFLSSIGLSDRTIQNLLDDVETPEVVSGTK